MSADKDVGMTVHVGRLGDLDNGVAVREIIAENLVHGHGHGIAGLARADHVDVALLLQIPGFLTDPQERAVPVHDAFDACSGVETLERFFRNVEHDAAGFHIAGGQQSSAVFDFFLP